MRTPPRARARAPVEIRETAEAGRRLTGRCGRSLEVGAGADEGVDHLRGVSPGPGLSGRSRPRTLREDVRARTSLSLLRVYLSHAYSSMFTMS